MPDQKGQGDQSFSGEQKPEKAKEAQNKGDQIKKEHNNYASKMWQNIQKSNSEKNRQNLKKEVSSEPKEWSKEQQPRQKQDQTKQDQPKQDQPRQAQQRPRQERSRQPRQDSQRPRQEQTSRTEQPKRDQQKPRQEQARSSQEQPKSVQPKAEVVKPKAEVVQPKTDVVKPKVEVVKPKPEVVQPIKPVQPKPEQIAKPINPFVSQGSQPANPFVSQASQAPQPSVPVAPSFVQPANPFAPQAAQAPQVAPVNPFAPQAAQAPQPSVPVAPSFVQPANPFAPQAAQAPQVPQTPQVAPVNPFAPQAAQAQQPSVPVAPSFAQPANPFAPQAVQTPQAAPAPQTQSWNAPTPKPSVPVSAPKAAPINPFSSNSTSSFAPKIPDAPKVSEPAKPSSAPVKDDFGPATDSVPKAPPVNPFTKSFDAIDAEVVGKKPEPIKEKPAAPKVQEIKEEVKVVEVKQEKSPLKEDISAPPAPPVEKILSERGAQVEAFKNELFHVLEQAGITKSTLISIVVFIFVIIFAIVGFNNGWHTAIINLFSKSPTTVVEQVVKRPDKTPVTTTTPQQNIPVASRGELVPSAYGVISAYIFGLEYKPNLPIVAVPMNAWGNDAGIVAANAFGMIEDERKIKFIEYVELLRKLQNIYNTDVYALLDMSTDRRAALQQHLNELGTLLQQAGAAFNDIDFQLQMLQTQYDPLLAQKDAAEKNFFAALYSFYGDNAYVNLGMFTKYNQDAVAIKSYFNSYKALRDLFITYINALNPRYNDISANTEALIKGIRVFYVPKSDIKTIITLGQ
jgi:hypothetical protein